MTLRILVDPGTYDCRNLGDLAMLQIAVERLEAAFPDSVLYVFTEAPDELRRHCPTVEPLSHQARMLWLDSGYLWGRFWNSGHGLLQRPLVAGQGFIRRRWPSTYAALIMFKRRLRPDNEVALEPFLPIFRGADCCVFCGQGTLADAAGRHAFTMLATAELARQAGMPVYMMGQGIGPLKEPQLRRRAAAVLPGAALIALREEHAGRAILRDLGVPGEQIVVTGDDAIELAYRARPPHGGDALGVHLRIAPQAVTDRGLVDQVRTAVHAFVGTHGVEVIPLPISHHQAGANDPSTIRLITADLSGDPTGGAATDTPAKLIAAVGRCRVVVTGAYHVAVFALSQGIPAVCLGQSAYYLDKFAGLRAQFGQACRPLRLDDPLLPNRLSEAIEAAWVSADDARAPLIAAAERQIVAGRAAYQSLLERQGAGTPAPLVPTGGTR